MAYEAKIIEVMIASPSDVSSYRQTVSVVLNEWNVVNSRDRAVLLVPVGWDTHSSPDLGGRPQQLINDRVLADCDVLVGIFWTRLGTPTGKAASGTVEEIEEHRRAGKPVMLYFSEEPVRPDSVSGEEYHRLREFRSWAESQGLVQTFSSAGDFHHKLARELPLTLKHNDHTRTLMTGSADPVDFVDVFHKALLEADPKAPKLRDEAKQMLIAAAQGDGSVYISRWIGGAEVIAGERAMNEPSEPRSVARWEAALRELRVHDYLSDVSTDGTVFQLTDAGYSRADAFGLTGEE